jgi:multisubunit Na+/H+ antiporter MnhE subunit
MVKTMAGVLFWNAVCLSIWLLTLSSLSVGELIVGSACSLVVGAAVVAACHAVGLRLAPTAPAFRPFLWLPLAIVSDAAQVLVLPLRPGGVRGRFRTLDLGDAGSSDKAVTRRAVATLGTTATPASVVLDANEKGEITLHALRTRGPHMEEGFTES